MDKIVFNNSCYFGVGVINQIATEIKNRHYEKGFIITDNGLIDAGIYQKIASILSRNKIPSVMFSDIDSEPTVKDIKNTKKEIGAKELEEKNFKRIISNSHIICNNLWTNILKICKWYYINTIT